LNNENNISSFEALQHYAVQPPAFILQNVKNILEAEEMQALKQRFNPLFEHAVAPPPMSFEKLMQQIKTEDDLNVFQPLKNFEVKPQLTFKRLMEIINGIALPKAKVVSFNTVKKYAAAAAVLIAVSTIAYFGLRKTDTVIDNNNIANNNTTVNPVIANTNTDTVVKDKLTNPTNNNSVAKNTKAKEIIYAKPFTSYSSSVVALPMQEMSINGENYPIIDNDYLATFASFSPDNLPTFLRAESPVATLISLDQYTSITISESMAGMMKKMYKTKTNGNPTRKARKQKAKLERWKKADIEFFNQNSNLNPLDPRDLSNFILNK
jgi:hypothetical protein